MTTSDLTIDQLIPDVSRMHEETVRVIEYSRTQAPRVSDVLNIFCGVFTIRRNCRRIVRGQSTLLQKLMTSDFTRVGPSQLQEIAESIESIVANGRELLTQISQLGSEIRFWWQSPLREFTQQIEHLDSIAESLRLECEPEVTTLLARAASRIVAEPRSTQGEHLRRAR